MSGLKKLWLVILVAAGFTVGLCGSKAAFAQGSRKDDVVFNAQGRPMAGATVRVCTAAATGEPCSPLALIYSDQGLTQALANPTTSDGLGNYTFYAAPGRYEIEISGPTITTHQFPNVILPNDPSSPTFTTVTSTSGISAFSLSLSGNLTVSGSAAVTGTLTVGGAPVPSTTADNAWTGPQRFQGPIPWHDITAYMPQGGCDNSAASLTREAGTISATSTALSITFNNGFKNGCGIFVAGAGATSTLVTPAQGTAPNPSVFGGTGSTTVHYKVSAIDANYGTSAASAPITVTTAPATRTALNYVGVYWQGVAGAVGYLVYSDASGSYAPLGYAYDCFGFASGNICGTIDKGTETNSWTDTSHSFWPLTPPASATNQALITTIASGGGTLNLTLAAAATNSVSEVFTFPDNSMFMKQALAAAASDGSPTSVTKGTVLVPEGLWFLSTIPFPASGSAGVKIVEAGAIELFGLPIEGTLGSTGVTGLVSIEGKGGLYTQGDWTLSCSEILGYPSMGALFVVYGPGSGVDLSHLCLNSPQTGIVQDSQGEVTMADTNFQETGSGPMLQVDNNAFFSLFDRTDWNDSANNSNNNIPAIWFLGLTNTGHTSVFDFRDNSFIAHTVRVDQAFPPGGGPTGQFVFDGTTNIEDNWDVCFICLQTNTAIQGVEFDNVATGDIQAPFQTLIYSYDVHGPNPGNNIILNGYTGGFGSLVGAVSASGNPTNCVGWIYESPSYGGGGSQSLGYWGNNNGTYSGCDYGITQIGGDVQTNEVLVAGGNDPSFGPAGEQMLGHVFRRRQATVTGTSTGSLASGTYYFKVTAVDVAGRESAPSPEVSQSVGASSSISLSASTGIYFPASCNFYFGTTAGSEGDYFNSTAVTNGTCTFTLATTTGETAKAPGAVGNAMRTWLSEENNASSCLFCGAGGGLGTGFLGFNLTASQYGAPISGVQFPFNGGVHSYKFYSASETSAPTGIASVDELYADSTAHRWVMINNNGTATSVAGLADFAAPPAIGGTTPAAVAGTSFTCPEGSAPSGASGKDILYCDSTAHRWKKIENNGAVQTVGSADSSACAYQGPASAVTGTGAAATYFTCTLPAGVMGAGQGIIITVLAKHTTGTAAVNYTLSFGGTSTTAVAPTGAANQLERISYLVMNTPGSSSVQTISTVGQDSNAGNNSVKLDTAAVNTASAVTINLQFNVAATDAITPEMFLVELKQ